MDPMSPANPTSPLNPSSPLSPMYDDDEGDTKKVVQQRPDTPDDGLTGCEMVGVGFLVLFGLLLVGLCIYDLCYVMD